MSKIRVEHYLINEGEFLKNSFCGIQSLCVQENPLITGTQVSCHQRLVNKSNKVA